MVAEEVRRLDASLKQLLEYARPTAPRRQRASARALVLQAVERATFAGGPAAGLAVAVEGDDAEVVADELQVGQVLLNLLANAAQAGAGELLVTLERGEARVRIAVADDGAGVDPKVAEGLFRPFVTTKARGAGLGLAASRRMARDNGGELSLLPSARGARFALDLPEAP